jgi:hypothetical protein
MPPDLLTIGYEGCVVGDVLATLREANVGLLIDVRAVAASRKPGFSKRQLAAGLDEVGIRYLHLQRLGTPKPGRDAVRAGHPERMVPIFNAHMETPEAQWALAEAKAQAIEGRCCLLCFERDHRHCHRHLVAAMIVADTGQAVVHLEAPGLRPGPDQGALPLGSPPRAAALGTITFCWAAKSGPMSLLAGPRAEASRSPMARRLLTQHWPPVANRSFCK